jgi:hypothetical protein
MIYLELTEEWALVHCVWQCGLLVGWHLLVGIYHRPNDRYTHMSPNYQLVYTHNTLSESVIRTKESRAWHLYILMITSKVWWRGVGTKKNPSQNEDGKNPL